MSSHVEHGPVPASPRARLRRSVLAALATLLAAAALFAASKASAATVAASARPANRAEAAPLDAGARRIAAGIQRLYKVRSAGIGQWVPTRDRHHRDDPVLPLLRGDRDYAPTAGTRRRC